MTTTILRPILVLGALSVSSGAAMGCVSDRPSRNGVFNENNYVRKAFLIKAGEAGPTDTGYTWRFNATVTAVSTPNPLAGLGVFPGAQSAGDSLHNLAGPHLVRFSATHDKLQLINLREISPAPPSARVPEAIDAWPVTHVDLKYRVNLDGEKTNFYEENQELDWEKRQFLKLNFAKNEPSDVAALGATVRADVATCTETTNTFATLVPGSFKVDEEHGYIQWNVAVTLPLRFEKEECRLAFGEMGVSAERVGRSNVTMNLLYSLARTDLNPTEAYKPLELEEKDPIRHKYGTFMQVSTARDPDSGRLAAHELVVRWNPERTAPVVWYFDRGFPAEYKKFFTDPGGIKEKTNQLLKESGAKLQFDFRDAPADVTLGDVRYSWLLWLSDKDSASGFAGRAQWVIDPTSGEIYNASIVLNDFEIKEVYVQRINSYLKLIGAIDDVNDATWSDAPFDPSDPEVDKTKRRRLPVACTAGQAVPLLTKQVRDNFNASSTLFKKMATVLNTQIPLTLATGVTPGPSDFVPVPDPQFTDAYFAALPYTVFDEPDQNVFVTPAGGGTRPDGGIWKLIAKEVAFQKLTAMIDSGRSPFDNSDGPDLVRNAKAYVERLHDLTQSHHTLQTALNTRVRSLTQDEPGAFSFDSVMQKSARHCLAGHWETKEEWTTRLITTYWRQTTWHEFGHTLGLRHNFMASVDSRNFPTVQVAGADGKPVTRPSMYSSSVMEYNSTPDRVFWEGGWGPYDQGAIAWTYANGPREAVKPDDPPATSVSGQVSATKPWKDPKGFADGKELAFLYCTDGQVKRSPFCKRGDLGVRPSEIIANAIEAYEWQYFWRNFRGSRKIWNIGGAGPGQGYASAAANFAYSLRNFEPIHAYDWTFSKLPSTLRKIGIKAPVGGSEINYFLALAAQFNKELSYANQIAAAFNFSIVQQGSGERPYTTAFDRYYGDTTQQGIILDKVFAIQSFSDLWYVDNYDRNFQGGVLASFGSFFGDPQYGALSDRVIESMVGGGYDVYTFQVPASVAAFAAATQRAEFNFSGKPQLRDWIGSLSFRREVDLLQYFQSQAYTYQRAQTQCPTGKYCNYDPRKRRGFDTDVHQSDLHNEFVGPDGRNYIWVYLPTRNQWLVADKDRNYAMWTTMWAYTEAVVYGEADGTGVNVHRLEKQIRYFADFYIGANN